MASIDTQFIDVSQKAIPLYPVVIALEFYLVRSGRVRTLYGASDTVLNFVFAAGGLIIAAVSGVTIGATIHAGLSWVYVHRLFEIPNNWATLLIVFVLDDFRYYWYHRLSHQVNWFWSSHLLHHTSTYLNFTTPLRRTWTFSFVSVVSLMVAPIVWLGFHPGFVAFATSINFFYQFFNHTESFPRMPRWFEWLMNCSTHHRIHHSSNTPYLDSNFGGTLIIWDRIFGTFASELPAEPPRYGLTYELDTNNPFRLAFHGYTKLFGLLLQRGLTWSDRRNYLLGKPGWSHHAAPDTIPPQGYLGPPQTEELAEVKPALKAAK